MNPNIYKMNVKENMVVSVSYSLSVSAKGATEKVFVEKTDAQNPLVFLNGTGSLLPDFETNLMGLKVGDTFEFSIAAASGYGENDPEALVDIPVSAFVGPDGKVEEGLLEVGNVIPMSDSEGNRMQGTIAQVGLETIKMDFNHPLAGKDLHFTGKVEDVREATADEIAHGHVHGAGGHHH